MLYFFFFSSRRRHTRLQGDWSSDVCSSDLGRDGLLLAGDQLRLNRSCGCGPDAREVLLAPGFRVDRHPRVAVPGDPATAGPPSPVSEAQATESPVLPEVWT